jgi:hypothetical protein
LYCRYKETGTDYLEQTPIDSTTTTIEGLDSFQLYEFRVMAENVVGRGIPTMPIDVQTDEARMFAIHCLYYTHITHMQHPMDDLLTFKDEHSAAALLLYNGSHRINQMERLL